MGGGVVGSMEVESRLADMFGSVLSHECPATACTPLGRGTDNEGGTTANGGGLGLQSRK